MDMPPEEMQHLGFVGIFRESFKIIWKHKQTLSLITLVFVLPLAFVFLAQVQAGDYFTLKLYTDKDRANHAERDRARLSSVVTTDRVIFCLVYVAYYAVLMVLSLLSVSSIVYLVACVYTMKPVTFKGVTAAVPKVWKRLAVTLAWAGLASILYGFFVVGLWVVVWGLLVYMREAVAWTVYIVITSLDAVGFAYLCIVWYIGSVVSVLEDLRGIKAMVKAKDLFTGKRRVVASVFVLFSFAFVGINHMFYYLAEYRWHTPFHVGSGILCLSLLTALFLLGLVAQTVVYFVCKSYHYELVDKPALSDHLEAFLPNYERLKEGRDIQLRRVNA